MYSFNSVLVKTHVHVLFFYDNKNNKIIIVIIILSIK